VVGIVDPPRPEVAAAIDDAHRAGVEVMMITGDHPRTAARIAEQLRIDQVRARVDPADKLRIVEELQQAGQVVAMTGDGVNDAPALQRADIGVAMGINGTEVAKEAADMILVDDNFATILTAVREGREILADIRKVLRYLLASNTGELLVVFLGVLGAGVLGLSGSGDEAAIPLLATQILWINLLTDGALALALGVDPAVDDVMAAPPRRLDARVVDASMVATIVLVGVTSALAGLVALDLGMDGGMLGGSGDLRSARTMLFTTLVMAQIFNSLNSRSDQVSAFVRPFDNRLLWGSIVLAVLLQFAVVHLAPLQEAFDTVDLDARDWMICVGLGSSVLFVDEVRKWLAGRSRRRAAAAIAS
jgi:magnesium-transporting ATPase (P-type)